MLLEELDGFIAGVLVCPEVIPPSEWLPVVWGQTDDQTAPDFDTVAHMNKMPKAGIAISTRFAPSSAGLAKQRGVVP
jgi:yecA family protein